MRHLFVLASHLMHGAQARRTWTVLNHSGLTAVIDARAGYTDELLILHIAYK